MNKEKMYQVFARHEMDYMVHASSMEEAERIAKDIWYEEAKSSDDPEITDVYEIDNVEDYY